MKAVTVVNVWKISLKGHAVKHQDVRSYRGHAGPCFHCEKHTQCTEETNTKRKALPPQEKGLWVHSQESQDSTPRKGQEKEIPCTQSDLPPRDKGQCGSRRDLRTTAFGMCCLPEYAPSLQPCSRHWIGSLRYNEQEQTPTRKEQSWCLICSH